MILRIWHIQSVGQFRPFGVRTASNKIAKIIKVSGPSNRGKWKSIQLTELLMIHNLADKSRLELRLANHLRKLTAMAPLRRPVGRGAPDPASALVSVREDWDCEPCMFIS